MVALKGFPGDSQPRQFGRLTPEVEISAPWGRRTGQKSRLFRKERFNATASLVRMSTLGSPKLSILLFPDSATPLFAENTMRNGLQLGDRSVLAQARTAEPRHDSLVSRL
jgi:hypothetical protein